MNCGFHPIVKNGQPVIFCGPTVLCAITGHDQKTIEATILYIRNNTKNWWDYKFKKEDYFRVEGMWNPEMVAVLEAFGYEVKDCYGCGKTVYQLTNDTFHKNGYVIIQVNGHFLVAHNGYVMDTSNPIPVRAKDMVKYKKSKVRKYFLVRKKEG